MQTRHEHAQPLPAHDEGALPAPLATLQMLNQVARSLGYTEGGGSPYVAVVEGVGTLLRADGVAVLVRNDTGQYVFRVAQGGLAEWADYALSGNASELLDALHARDKVTLFKRTQKNAWAREFLLAAGMHWGALVSSPRHREDRGGRDHPGQARPPERAGAGEDGHARPDRGEHPSAHRAPPPAPARRAAPSREVRRQRASGWIARRGYPHRGEDH